MVTVIRQHVEGYISFLIYGDNSQCLVSYCKKTKCVNVKMKDEKQSCNMSYNHNEYSEIGGYLDMIDAFLINTSAFTSEYSHILNKAIQDIDSHMNRRFIPSISKPYSKPSTFNPKNRRVISFK